MAPPMSKLGSPFGQAWPDRFNLCTYFLDHNVDEGRGEKTALVCGQRSHTYASLQRRVIRLTAALRGLGLGAEDRVLIVLPDGLEFAETWFATLRAGGVFAMVNPLLKAKDFNYYLEYTKARVLVTDSSVLAEIGEAARSSRHLRGVLVVGSEAGDFTPYEGAIDAQSEEPGAGFVEPTGPDDLAGWLFTSGSTGEPKACVHMQRDFAFSTETFALQVAGYREDDVCLSVPKLFFGYATGTNLMFPFRVGATAILFPERSTPDAIFDLIEQHRPTFLTSVPTLINNMLRSERCDQADLSSLRVCLSAGEALPASLYEQWMERTGVEVLDGIGSAEMFHIYISNRMGDVRVGSLGKLVPGYEADILGPDGEVVAPGEPGRLRIRGGSTALCYWGDKAKSQETFQADACTTADVFSVDEEGYFHYVGRGDDLLKVSGIWVSPLEIENALLVHPAVDEVCVIGKADKDDLVKPQAFVVLAEGHPGDEALAGHLKAHLKDHLAPHKYPRWFEWCAELPKNDRGKVNRKLLKARS
ncbi:MAG: 4-hydroxybenzoate--CoA ligase [Planctomycetes bacterium]|nr:4-hydroxybenzoate--CoA ligase [Planctomycetota bacterium]